VKKILVIDDSETIRQQVKQALASTGYEIVEAVDGVDGLEKLRAMADLDMALCDVNMPRMNGLEMLEHLRMDFATANIPVTAANIAISNILHVANFADIVSAYTATGTATPKDLTIDNCEFRDSASNLNFIKTVTGNATANSMDGFNYTNNKVFGLATTAATTAVIMAAAQNRQVYSGNFINYPALSDTAALVAFGANNQSNLLISANRVVRPSTSTTGGLLLSGGSTASSGYVVDNYIWHLDNSAALIAPTGTALGFQNNFSMITGAADKSGLINPAAV